MHHLIQIIVMDTSLDTHFVIFMVNIGYNKQADAHMSYMKENIMSETDITAIVRASSAGRKWQISSADIDRLELIDISDDIVTLADFTDVYGDYMIVGWIYGGEIVYESTYSAKNEESKQEIKAELWYVLPSALRVQSVSCCYAIFMYHTVIADRLRHQDSVSADALRLNQPAITERRRSISRRPRVSDQTMMTLTSRN